MLQSPVIEFVACIHTIESCAISEIDSAAENSTATTLVASRQLIFLYPAIYQCSAIAENATTSA